QEGIAFHQHAVRERAAVTFVGVADHVFLRALRLGHGLPFDPRREADATAAAQAGLGDFAQDLLAADPSRALEAAPAAGRLVILEAQRPGLARARERQPLLAGDERMLLDRADGDLAGPAFEDVVDVLDRRRAEALAVDLDQRLEPLHAPAADALDLVALSGESCGELVGAESAGEGVV